MFIRTPPELLEPLRFALSKPFEFNAQARLESGPFKLKNADRSDLDALRSLCIAYDNAKSSLLPYMMQVWSDLEKSYTFRIPEGSVPKAFSTVNVNAKLPRLEDRQFVENTVRHECAQRQADRLFDHLKIRARGSKNPATNDTLLRVMSFYLLNEAVGLALAGIAQVEEVHPKHFKLQPKSIVQAEMLKCLWFSRATSNNSFASTMLYAKKLSEARHLSQQDTINAFIEYFIDKEFWVRWKSIPLKGIRLKTVIHMWKVSEIVARLLIAQFSGITVKCSRAELDRLNISLSSVLEIFGRQNSFLVTDHFIGRNDRDELVLHIDSMTLGLRNYIVSYAAEHEETDQLRLMVGGVFFEKETIINRLSEDASYSDRYAVYAGFDRNITKDHMNEADVDLVIFDSRLSQYYFVQVKHAALGDLAYFEGAAKCLGGDLQKGIKQLLEAKRLIECGYIESQLNKLGLHAVTPENCHFILIHNLEGFDYQSTSDGIALYDWLTFRNLLLDCRIVSSGSNQPDMALYMPKAIPLNDPVHLVKTLLDEHPALSSSKETILLMENVSTHYSVEGVEVTLVSLGL